MKKNIVKSTLFILFFILSAGCTKMEFTRTNNLSKYNLSDIPDDLNMYVGDTLSVTKLDITNLDHFLFPGGISQKFRILDRDTEVQVTFFDSRNKSKTSQLYVRQNDTRFTNNEDELSIYGAFSDTQRITTSMGVFYNASTQSYQLTIYRYPYEITIELDNNFPGKLYGRQQQYEVYNSMNSSYYDGKNYFKANMVLSTGGIGSTYVGIFDKKSVLRFIQGHYSGEYRLDFSHVLFENTTTNDQIYMDLNFNNI